MTGFGNPNYIDSEPIVEPESFLSDFSFSGMFNDSPDKCKLGPIGTGEGYKTMDEGGSKEEGITQEAVINAIKESIESVVIEIKKESAKNSAYNLSEKLSIALSNI